MCESYCWNMSSWFIFHSVIWGRHGELLKAYLGTRKQSYKHYFNGNTVRTLHKWGMVVKAFFESRESRYFSNWDLEAHCCLLKGERKAPLEQISDVDFTAIHEEISSKRHGDTGSWFLQCIGFREWLEKSSHGILWLNGRGMSPLPNDKSQ